MTISAAPPGTAQDDPDPLGVAVGRAQLGDSAAFTVVYRTVHPLLMRYLRSMVGQDAEDVASETWLQISRDLSKFAGDGDAFRGWAATLGRHRALDHLRAAKRRPRAAHEELDPGVLAGMRAPGDVESALLDAEATRRALDLIGSLPKEQAEALLLRVVMDLDAEATARVLGKRAGAVRTATHRGLRRLAAQLDARAGPVPERPAFARTGESIYET